MSGPIETERAPGKNLALGPCDALSLFLFSSAFASRTGGSRRCWFHPAAPPSSGPHAPFDLRSCSCVSRVCALCERVTPSQSSHALEPLASRRRARNPQKVRKATRSLVACAIRRGDVNASLSNARLARSPRLTRPARSFDAFGTCDRSFAR